MGRSGTDPRRGYALLAVLWITAGIGALTTLTTVAAREAIAGSRNRIGLTSALWRAEACLAHARTVLSRSLRQDVLGVPRSAGETWNRIDRVLAATPPPRQWECELAAEAVGSRLDVNAADRATLSRLLRELGMRPGRADSAGAEIMAARPFADARQLAAIAGMEWPVPPDSFLDVEPGAIAVNHAPPQVLALLPGFTDEAVERVMFIRERGALIGSLADIREGLTAEARDSFDLGSAKLLAVMAFEPGAWIVTARGTAGEPRVTMVVEHRLGRSAGTTVLWRRRSWIE